MSRLRRVQTSALVLFAAAGWITAAVLALDDSRKESRFEVVNSALTDSIVERESLSQELEQVTALFNSAQQKLSSAQNQVADSSTRLDGLPDHVQEKLLAGAVGKYVTVTRAKLRSGPSTQSQELAVLSPETPIEVLGVAADGQWLEVARIGYVHNDLLRPIP